MLHVSLQQGQLAHGANFWRLFFIFFFFMMHPFYFPRFIATWAPVVPQYISKNINAHPSSNPTPKLVNLLITLAANGHDGDFLSAFEEKGITPDTEASILSFDGNNFQPFTTSTYLAVLGTQTGREMPGVESNSYFWRLLENFLHFGADPDVLFLILCGRHTPETPTIRRTRGRDIHKLLLCTLPEWAARHMVCTRFPNDTW